MKTSIFLFINNSRINPAAVKVHAFINRAGMEKGKSERSIA
jgi:hypothetical protein